MAADYRFSTYGDPASLAVLFAPGADFERVAAAGVLWLLCIWLLYTFSRHAMNRTPIGRRLFGALNAEQRESFLMWVVQLVVTTICLIIVYHYGAFVVVTGSFNQALHADSVSDTDWGTELLWLRQVRDAMACWGYGGQPMLFLYLYEIFAVSAVREVQASHHLLTMHHLIAIFLLCYCIKALMMTLDARWGQMLVLMFNLMAMEQLTWIGLIWYRMKLPGRAVLMAFSTVVEVCLRIVNWCFLFYCYAHLCWLRCTLTRFETVWRVLFPLLAILMIAAQALVIRIHAQISIRALGTAHRELPNVEPFAGPGRRSPAQSAEVQSPTLDSGVVDAASSPIAVSNNSMELPSVFKVPTTQIPAPTLPAAELNPSTTKARHTRGEAWPWATTTPGYVMAVVTIVMIAVLYGAEAIQPSNPVVEVRCGRVAVVGGGAAGLSTAWALTRDQLQNFEVTLFEASGRFGGAARTEYVGTGMVETGVQVFSRFNHNVNRLHAALGVEGQTDPRGTAAMLEGRVSAANQTLEQVQIYNIFTHFPSSDNRSLFAAQALGAEIDRFGRLMTRELPETMNEAEWMTTTLWQVMERYNFSTFFRDVFVTQCVQSILTLRRNALNTSIAQIVVFADLFGACISTATLPLDTVRGGIQSYIDRFVRATRASGAKLHLNSPISAVRHGGWRSVWLLVNGSWVEFDQVVFASPKERVRAILTAPQSSSLPAPLLYSTVLGAPGTRGETTYGEINVVVHSDTAWLKRKLKAMFVSGCYNLGGIAWVVSDRTRSVDDMLQPGASLDVPHQIHIPAAARATHCAANLSLPYALTHEPGDLAASQDLPSSSATSTNFTWRQVVHDPSHLSSLRAAHAIQGHRGLWFVGAEFTGINAHEAAVTSGFVAAHALGAAYPFETSPLARLMFLKLRNWLLFGENWMVPFTLRREARSKPCPRCP